MMIDDKASNDEKRNQSETKPFETETASAEESAQEEAFFALAALWAGRDVTQESLRRQAWPSRNLLR